MNDALIPIPPYTIHPDIAANFDLYLQTNNGQFMLFCATGRKMSEMEIVPNPTGKLFILRKDWNPYHLYVGDNIDGLIDAPGLNATERASMAMNTLTFTAEHMFRNPRAELIHRHKTAIRATLKQVIRNPAVIHHLIRMAAPEFSLFSHGVKVGIYGMGIMRELLEDGNLSAEAVTGLFLHDIGKYRIPVEILYKKGALSPAETRALRNHVEEGIKLLGETRALNRDVEIILSQHHERRDGSGYPLGLRGDALHPNAIICIIADTFDNLTASRQNQKGYSFFDALKIMKSETFPGINPLFFKKFVSLFTTGK